MMTTDQTLTACLACGRGNVPGETCECVAQVAERVLALDEQASAAPWTHRHHPWGQARVSVVDGHVVAMNVFTSDAELIAYYRTAAPQLARALVEALSDIAWLRARLDGCEEEILKS